MAVREVSPTLAPYVAALQAAHAGIASDGTLENGSEICSELARVLNLLHDERPASAHELPAPERHADGGGVGASVTACTRAARPTATPAAAPSMPALSRRERQKLLPGGAWYDRPDYTHAPVDGAVAPLWLGPARARSPAKTAALAQADAFRHASLIDPAAVELARLEPKLHAVLLHAAGSARAHEASLCASDDDEERFGTRDKSGAYADVIARVQRDAQLAGQMPEMTTPHVRLLIATRERENKRERERARQPIASATDECKPSDSAASTSQTRTRTVTGESDAAVVGASAQSTGLAGSRARSGSQARAPTDRADSRARGCTSNRMEYGTDVIDPRAGAAAGAPANATGVRTDGAAGTNVDAGPAAESLDSRHVMRVNDEFFDVRFHRAERERAAAVVQAQQYVQHMHWQSVKSRIEDGLSSAHASGSSMISPVALPIDSPVAAPLAQQPVLLAAPAVAPLAGGPGATAARDGVDAFASGLGPEAYHARIQALVASAVARSTDATGAASTAHARKLASAASVAPATTTTTTTTTTMLGLRHARYDFSGEGEPQYLNAATLSALDTWRLDASGTVIAPTPPPGRLVLSRSTEWAPTGSRRRPHVTFVCGYADAVTPEPSSLRRQSSLAGSMSLLQEVGETCGCDDDDDSDARVMASAPAFPVPTRRVNVIKSLVDASGTGCRDALGLRTGGAPTRADAATSSWTSRTRNASGELESYCKVVLRGNALKSQRWLYVTLTPVSRASAPRVLSLETSNSTRFTALTIVGSAAVAAPDRSGTAQWFRFDASTLSHYLRLVLRGSLAADAGEHAIVALSVTCDEQR